MDEDGNPCELLIMDSKDIDMARRVWRWNLNGLDIPAQDITANMDWLSQWMALLLPILSQSERCWQTG